MCSYNPGQPGIAYFDIGSAISALGFTLAIQQLLRPIYRFRLNSYGVHFFHLILGIFVGFISVLLAAALPSLPVSRDHIYAYPIFWELLGGIIIASIYGFAAAVILRPARVRNLNLIAFVGAAGKLLAEAKDEDRIEFSNDLYHNVGKLFKCARRWQVAEGDASFAEFERLKAIGAELVIRGRPPISAFYLFAHRTELERASYACSLLRLLADEKFCSVLVSECPWQTAAIIRKISELRLHVDQAKPFIQELGMQAVVNENSMMAREIGYDGFGDAPFLSQSLFQDPFIIRAYRPLNKLMFGGKNQTEPAYICRLNAAARMMLETGIEYHGYWDVAFMFDVEKAYEGLSHQIGWSPESDRNREYPELAWSNGIQELCRTLTSSFDKLDPHSQKALFVTKREQYRSDLVHIIASIAFESLSSIANAFDDFKGRFWLHCSGTIYDIYPFHDSEPAGMSPLQQQLALQLLDKLEQNMDGYYPSISKVLLATVGPYDEHPHLATRTAFSMLRDAVYKELQRLPLLYESKPEKIADFLPANVTYDPTANTLTHSYRGGQTAVTNLSALSLPDINLCDETAWRIANSASLVSTAEIASANGVDA